MDITAGKTQEHSVTPTCLSAKYSERLAQNLHDIHVSKTTVGLLPCDAKCATHDYARGEANNIMNKGKKMVYSKTL